MNLVKTFLTNFFPVSEQLLVRDYKKVDSIQYKLDRTLYTVDIRKD